jgi:hypothetical protein
MTTGKITIGHNGGAVPVACALTQADLTAQRGRWQQLAIQAMTGRAETADGLRISFRSDPGVAEELRALAAIEGECCPWATWTVDTDAQQAVLDIRSAGAGVAALHSMFSTLLPGTDGTQPDR